MFSGHRRAGGRLIAVGIASAIGLAGLDAGRLALAGEGKPRPDPTRYTGLWTDGTRRSGESVGPWHESRSSPKLAGRDLFDATHPIRWLIDNALPAAGEPDAAIELVGGDCLPGRVVGYSDGTDGARRRLPPHVIVAASTAVDWPDGPPRAQLRVTLPWIKRIVWLRLARCHEPRTLFLLDGRKVAFRSVRFTAEGVQVLREGEIREFGLGELAELHFPNSDPWDAYLDQLAGLSPGPGVRLVQWETSTGIRVTGTTERFQARAHGPADQPGRWFHMIQPAWCLDPLWIRHETIRVRAYFLPHELPLTRLDPIAARGQSDLGAARPWQLNRNVESGPLESGGTTFPWGFGVHAASELEFPLSPLARVVRTRLGLDHLAGPGGCVKARIFLGSTRTPPIYASPWVIGSDSVLDTGPLALPGGPQASDRLILQVDPAHADRPAGADPLDIRDALNWLESAITLDSDRVAKEVLLRSARHVAAWQGWKASQGGTEAVRLANRWDESDPRDIGYRLLVAAGREPVRLSGRLLPRPYRDQLLLLVARPPDSTPSKLEVRVEGIDVAQWEVPVRGSSSFPPLVVPLGAYHHKEIAVELVQTGQDASSLVEWGDIRLVNRTAVP